MGRLAWSQLRFRTTRLLALLAGMLLATTAFTVLTARRLGLLDRWADELPPRRARRAHAAARAQSGVDHP